MHIILHQPEIPANTGNIGRTCVATNTSLHLIEPLGFQINEKQLKRAGMDYWDKLDVSRYVNYQEFLDKHPDAVVWKATTKAHQTYSEVTFGPDDYIMFGKESAGIPEELLVEDEEHCIRIPMGEDIRSLNLSNSVAIILYEALRQQQFAGLEEAGELHRLHWEDKVAAESSTPRELECNTTKKKNASVSENARIAPSAIIEGDVELGDSSVWHHVTIRGDMEPIRIGNGSNIQDNAVVHTGAGFFASIGDGVTVGHSAVVHGCTIENNVIVGMGAIIMNGAHIGHDSIVAAGALVTEGKEFPPNSVIMGSPAKAVKEVTEDQLHSIRENATEYVKLAEQWLPKR